LHVIKAFLRKARGRSVKSVNITVRTVHSVIRFMLWYCTPDMKEHEAGYSFYFNTPYLVTGFLYVCMSFDIVILYFLLYLIAIFSFPHLKQILYILVSTINKVICLFITWSKTLCHFLWSAQIDLTKIGNRCERLVRIYIQ
jgi:hypothetical protein